MIASLLIVAVVALLLTVGGLLLWHSLHLRRNARGRARRDQAEFSVRLREAAVPCPG